MSLGHEFKLIEQIIEKKRNEMNILQKRKKEISKKIYDYMESKNLKTFQGIEYDQVAPKIKPKRMSKKEREEYNLKLLRQVGIPNPRAMLNEMHV